jgi:di/tricarboxylate transporter
MEPRILYQTSLSLPKEEMNLALAILIGGVSGVILGVYAGYLYDISYYSGYVKIGELVNDGFLLGVVGVVVAVVFPRSKGEPKSQSP